MQYMLLIYEDEAKYGDEKSGETMQKVIAGHIALSQELGAKRLGGGGLQNTYNATTVRTSENGDQILHDGPFAEAKEQLGGYYVIEADDLDEAISVAKRIPMLGSGSVEVRPLLGQGPAKGN